MVAPMFVHRSNRTELLVEALIEVVREPLSDAFTPERIAVEGRGMERWLAMALSRHFGAWANPDFPFPRRLIESLLEAIPGDAPTMKASPFAPENLRWAIAAILPTLLTKPRFDAARRYLKGDDSGVRQLQLAERIARTFDQYVVFRPEIISAWESGDDPEWQAVLWRALTSALGPHHFTSQARAFLGAAKAGEIPAERLPRRISVFGVSTLPPLYLEILAAAASQIEVHLFLLSPTHHYWADTRSLREQARARKRQKKPSAALPADVGHELLASLGRTGRDFQEVIEQAGNYEQLDRYDDPGTASALCALQSDILHLRQRGSAAPSAATLPWSPGDDSIRVHACHSPMREVEVLHDQIVDLLERTPDLRASDIIVLSPAIEAYAPLIDAVFGAVDGPPLVPYRIADRALRDTDDVAKALLGLLATLRGRMTASDVIDVLELPIVRARFGLEAEDVDEIRSWVGEAGIRWGIDAAHRAAVGQPEDAGNTWRFGFDRLLVGYAFEGGGERLFGGALPVDDIEGSVAERLGRFIDLCSTLFEIRRQLEDPRSVGDWCRDIGTLLDAIMAVDDHGAREQQRARDVLREIADAAEAGGFREVISLDAASALVESGLDRRAAGRDFLSGGVTFCALVPMRSIPFRVVCLLGLNDTTFPRSDHPPSFDVVARKPRLGDRSAREDDRYLFLEAILSARDKLLITHVGQSARDNSALPPSVVVSELLDAVQRMYGPPAGGPADQLTLFRPPDPIASIVVAHPLQPFSPRYFEPGDRRLFSYSGLFCAAARAMAGPRQPPPPFLVSSLAPLPREQRAVRVDELLEFFRNPSRALLRNRLALRLDEFDEAIDDREPIVLDALDRWKIGDDAIGRSASDHPERTALLWRASGRLPLGNLGTREHEEILTVIDAIDRVAEQLTGGFQRSTTEIDFVIEGTSVTGRIGNLFGDRRVVCSYSALSLPHELGPWILHLVLAVSGSPVNRSSLVGRGPGYQPKVTTFGPVAGAADLLAKLLEIYWRGQSDVTPFVRSASAELATRLDEPGKAFAAAESAFTEELERDPYLATIFPSFGALRGDEVRWGRFQDLAGAVYSPLVAHRSGERGATTGDRDDG